MKTMQLESSRIHCFINSAKYKDCRMKRLSFKQWIFNSIQSPAYHNTSCTHNMTALCGGGGSRPPKKYSVESKSSNDHWIILPSSCFFLSGSLHSSHHKRWVSSDTKYDSLPATQFNSYHSSKSLHYFDATNHPTLKFEANHRAVMAQIDIHTGRFAAAISKERVTLSCPKTRRSKYRHFSAMQKTKCKVTVINLKLLTSWGLKQTPPDMWSRKWIHPLQGWMLARQ